MPSGTKQSHLLAEQHIPISTICQNLEISLIEHFNDIMTVCSIASIKGGKKQKLEEPRLALSPTEGELPGKGVATQELER